MRRLLKEKIDLFRCCLFCQTTVFANQVDESMDECIESVQTNFEHCLGISQKHSAIWMLACMSGIGNIGKKTPEKATKKGMN